MKKAIITVPTILLFFVGFASAQDKRAPIPFDFYPLKVGMSWTYQVTDFKKKPVKVDPKVTVKVEVEKEETYARTTTNKDGKKIVDKFTGFLLKNSGGQQSKHDHLVVLEDGVYRVETAKLVLTPPLLIFKAPLEKAGATWEVNSIVGKEVIKGTFTAKADRVTVPAGTYNAWAIRFQSDPSVESPFEFTNWFAEGTGIVKHHTKSKDHERMMELQQVSGGK